MSALSYLFKNYLDKREALFNKDHSYIDFENSISGLIEIILTESSSEEIFDFLIKQNEEDLFLMPFWFRSLCFKLIVLDQPQNLLFLQKAYNDLDLFGEPVFRSLKDDYYQMMKRITNEDSDLLK